VNLKRETLRKPLSEPCENSYQQNYKSNLSWETNGNIDQTTLVAKQSETQLQDLPDGKDISRGKLQKRRSTSKPRSIYTGKGARRDREPWRLPWKKILNLFNKSKATREAKCKISNYE